MEQYSLLILFVAMIVVWLFAWQPWKKRPDDLSQGEPDHKDEDSGRRR
jgi:hypothetical protein